MAAVEAAPSETDGVDPIRVTCLPARDPWIGSDPAWGQGCVNTHPALRPHQGVSEGGRSRHGPSRPCATAYRAAEPHDVAALQDKQDGRCASPEGQSVKRPPTSFAHSSAAVRRSAGTVPRAPVWRTPFPGGVATLCQ